MKGWILFALLPLLASAQASDSTLSCFQGTWKGELVWHRSGKPPQTIVMELQVRKNDSTAGYAWTLVYGQNRSDVRAYELKPVNRAGGHWVVDEKNGILLDQFYLAGELSGVFTVSGTTLFNRYRPEGNRLYVEFISFDEATLQTSGGNAGIPQVTTRRVKAMQKGYLYKISEQ